MIRSFMSLSLWIYLEYFLVHGLLKFTWKSSIPTILSIVSMAFAGYFSKVKIIQKTKLSKNGSYVYNPRRGKETLSKSVSAPNFV